MQRFVSDHVPSSLLRPAADYFGVTPGAVVHSFHSFAVETTFVGSSPGPAGGYLCSLAVAEFGDFTNLSATQRVVSTSGCLCADVGQMYGFLFRVELPNGTSPQTVTYADLVAGENMFATPIRMDTGLNTASWRDFAQLDLKSRIPGFAVFYGVAIRVANTAAPSLVDGLISARAVHVDIPVVQPNK